jgi:flagellin
MPLVISSNLFASTVRFHMNRTGEKLQRLSYNLASGTNDSLYGAFDGRVALADQLRTQTKVATVALQNANDGLSYLATADSALEEMQLILTRMAELANQGANSTFTSEQRSALQLEFSALGSEIDRISAASTFNGFNTLSTSSNITLHVGVTSGAESSITMQSVTATVLALGLGSAGGDLSYSISGISADEAITASRLAYSALLNAQDSLAIKRGTVDALTSRLSIAVEYLSVARETYSAAESTIRDSDTARDLAEFTRLNVVQQSQTALLAQANQIPALALKLLTRP